MIQWYSTYKLHHKKVASFSKDSIFFCGDAAHVHSPAGGQGMNTGLQDAYNLAWKLALVINGEAKQTLLNTYHEERNPVAENLLKTTDRMFSLMSQNKTTDVLLRMYLVPSIMPVLMKVKSFRRKFFLLVSQTEINYNSSSLSKGEAGKLKAGMRFPYIKLSLNNEIISGFQFIRSNAFKPFLLLYYGIEVYNLQNKLYTSAQIERNSFNDDALHNAAFSASFICLLRPDNYIGYIAETFNQTELDQYLHSILD